MSVQGLPAIHDFEKKLFFKYFDDTYVMKKRNEKRNENKNEHNDWVCLAPYFSEEK